MEHVFQYNNFIQEFPEWAELNETQISPFFDIAKNFVYAFDNKIISGNTLQYALNLICAHILQIKKNTTDAFSASSAAGFAEVGANNTSGVLTSANEGSVSVSFAPPPSRSAWQYWLNQTPYGQQFLALFSSLVLGGFYIGGLPESQAFRKTGGTWR